MKKPPAFQLYADDFVGGTSDMTQAEIGSYILLLCYQWNRGAIPSEPERQQMIAKGPVTKHVLQKFKTGEDGQLRNERLELVRAERMAWIEKQIESGKRGAQSRWQKDSKPIASPLGSPSQAYDDPNGKMMALQSPVSSLQSPTPIPSPSPPSSTGAVAPTATKREAFKKPDFETVKLAAAKGGLPPLEAERFFNHYESNGWRVGKNPMRSLPHAIANWKLNLPNYGYAQRTNQPNANGAANRNQHTYAERRLKAEAERKLAQQVAEPRRDAPGQAPAVAGT